MPDQAKRALFLAATALVAIEAAAWLFLPYRHLPAAAAAISNPERYRGWPEFLRQGDDRRPVIVISNSQGMALDVEADQRYAGIIRAALAERSPPEPLENWSVDGMQTAEVELLTL